MLLVKCYNSRLPSCRGAAIQGSEGKAQSRCRESQTPGRTESGTRSFPSLLEACRRWWRLPRRVGKPEREPLRGMPHGLSYPSHASSQPPFPIPGWQPPFSSAGSECVSLLGKVRHSNTVAVLARWIECAWCGGRALFIPSFLPLTFPFPEGTSCRSAGVLLG